MSKKKEKAVQFFLPIGGSLVNQCCYVSEDELEEKDPIDAIPALLEKAVRGELSPRTLSRRRDELLREALRQDRAEALSRLLPQKRMEPARFRELLAFAESCRSPDAMAALLSYRRAHYRPAEFEALEQRQLELELGLSEPEAGELRRIFHLRYRKEGVCICGVKSAQRSYEIPAAIGGKPVVGVDAAAFCTPDPLPRVERAFSDHTAPEGDTGKSLFLGRAMEKRGCPETPLRWRILRREAGRALVLCERVVAVLPWHPELQEVCWESCALRKWLNTVFLPLSFTPAERERILPTAVITPDNPNYATPGGPQTEDRLFLLSAEEAAELLPEDAARSLNCWWWLRSPGFDNSFAAVITPEGAIMRIGSFVDTDDYAVRPAMWIRTDET